MIGSDYKQFIQVGEHAIKMPPCPKDKNDVIFVDHKDPVWIRDEALADYRDIWYNFIPYHTKLYQQASLYDQDGILISLNKEDSDYITRIYQREWHRREYGVHVKIANEIIWLTGDHWFILAWCKTKRPDKQGDYFDYREFQAWFLYMLWHINGLQNVSGGIFSKAKKTGITNIMWLYYLNKATRTRNINLGHMTLDRPKGAKTFREHFLYAFHGLPMPLKTQVKSKTETDGVITFGKQFTNSKKSKIIKSDTDDELGTSVMCVPTMINAFDIDVFSDTWYDEYVKHVEDFGEIYRSNEEATSIQDSSVGKKWLTSYTPEGQSPSFVFGRELFLDSKKNTIRPESNGQTKSKLLAWHIPAYQSWSSSFDRHGKCNEVEAINKIQARRNLLKGKPKELQAETRRYANTEKEAWSTGGSGSVFDPGLLSELYSDREEEQRNSMQPFIEGKLEWTNKLWEAGLKNKRPKGAFCPVELVPLTEKEMERGETGRLRQYYSFPKSHANMALNRGKDQWGCLIPPLEHLYTFGADPTQHAAASEVIEGSKNAYYVMNRADEHLDALAGRVMSKVIMFEYYERPELPDEAYEDLLKLIIYTGAIGIPEANVPEFATRLLSEGLGYFLIVKDENGIMTPWKRWMGLAHETDKRFQFIRTTANSNAKEVLETFVRLIKFYIQSVAPGEKDYGKTIKSLRLLKQLQDIDITNTRIFDLFMAWGYNLLSDEIYSASLLSQSDDYSNANNIGAVLGALAN